MASPACIIPAHTNITQKPPWSMHEAHDQHHYDGGHALILMLMSEHDTVTDEAGAAN